MKGLFILAIDTTLCALWKLEGRESRQRSNCTIALVKRSDCGDLLEVKSRTTAIAGGVVSSIELFSYAERESLEVNERLRIATSCSTAGLPSFPPFIACRTVPALVLLYILLLFHIDRFVFIY